MSHIPTDIRVISYSSLVEGGRTMVLEKVGFVAVFEGQTVKGFADRIIFERYEGAAHGVQKTPFMNCGHGVSTALTCAICEEEIPKK